MTKDEAMKPEQEPVAWVRNLKDPHPHCVTDLAYRSIADTLNDVDYIPLYTAPPKQPGQEKIVPGDYSGQAGDYMEQEPVIGKRFDPTPPPVATVVDEYSKLLTTQPEQDHGFDRTASHMAGEYVDTAPPSKPWVGLTDEELISAYESEQAGRWGDHIRSLRAIEAKLKEKNT